MLISFVAEWSMNLTGIAIERAVEAAQNQKLMAAIASSKDRRLEKSTVMPIAISR